MFYLVEGHPETSKRSRLLIVPARLPRLTVVPVPPAAMKHTLVLYAMLDLPQDSAPSGWPAMPTTDDERSISPRCTCMGTFRCYISTVDHPVSSNLTSFYLVVSIPISIFFCNLVK